MIKSFLLVSNEGEVIAEFSTLLCAHKSCYLDSSIKVRIAISIEDICGLLYAAFCDGYKGGIADNTGDVKEIPDGEWGYWYETENDCSTPRVSIVDNYVSDPAKIELALPTAYEVEQKIKSWIDASIEDARETKKTYNSLIYA